MASTTAMMATSCSMAYLLSAYSALSCWLDLLIRAITTPAKARTMASPPIAAPKLSVSGAVSSVPTV